MSRWGDSVCDRTWSADLAAGYGRANGVGVRSEWRVSVETEAVVEAEAVEER